MISRAATILAIAIPLGLCLAVSLSMAVILLICLVRHRHSHQRDSENTHELQQKLDIFKNLSNSDYADNGILSSELKLSYEDTYWGETTPLWEYIKKWIASDKTPPMIPDEVSRLEAVLFPQVQASNYLSIDRDRRVFHNPQEYTSTEIVTHLRSPCRAQIVQHIMVSILLRNTSIKGNPPQTLLPLDPTEVDGLYNLSIAIRNGLQLPNRLSAHICRLGFYRAKKTYPEYYEREPYHTLFETLFQPYFKSNSPEDVAERRADLNEAITAAVAHGMKCLGCIREVDYWWGEKHESNVEVVPAMLVSQFRDGKLQCTQTIVESYLK